VRPRTVCLTILAIASAAIALEVAVRGNDDWHHGAGNIGFVTLLFLPFVLRILFTGLPFCGWVGLKLAVRNGRPWLEGLLSMPQYSFRPFLCPESHEPLT
jgi:hypothetical protein